jgi:hypothetical protein
MARLAETFQHRDSRVDRVFLVVDINDSTTMKRETPESDWITTYGWFYDLLPRS